MARPARYRARRRRIRRRGAGRRSACRDRSPSAPNQLDGQFTGAGIAKGEQGRQAGLGPCIAPSPTMTPGSHAGRALWIPAGGGYERAVMDQAVSAPPTLRVPTLIKRNTALFAL